MSQEDAAKTKRRARYEELLGSFPGTVMGAILKADKKADERQAAAKAPKPALTLDEVITELLLLREQVGGNTPVQYWEGYHDELVDYTSVPWLSEDDGDIAIVRLT